MCYIPVSASVSVWYDFSERSSGVSIIRNQIINTSWRGLHLQFINIKSLRIVQPINITTSAKQQLNFSESEILSPYYNGNVSLQANECCYTLKLIDLEKLPDKTCNQLSLYHLYPICDNVLSCQKWNLPNTLALRDMVNLMLICTFAINSDTRCRHPLNYSV